MTQTAIQKREAHQDALARFAPANLSLPLCFPQDPALPPSPKPRYRSHYRYLGPDGLDDPQTLATYSNFDVAVRLFDYANLERLLATHIYVPSAKGQVPFHPLSLYLLWVYRREHDLSRHETLRRLRHENDGRELRQRMGFTTVCPSESGLRYFEKQISPELQWEINAQQMDLLYRAGLLPTQPDAEQKVTLTFDGMLHEARSRMRCASVTDSCYQPAPRPCPAQDKGKRGCDCDPAACAQICRYATPRDPQARLIVYSRRKPRPDSPNTSLQKSEQKSSRARLVYGYYSYAGQILDPELATYWILPAAFGPATTDERTLFPENFPALQTRFPWLQIEAVTADAGAGFQGCLDLIWEAGALRLVDIRAVTSDDDPEMQLARGYDDKGYPLCPFGYTMHANGHDYQRRRTKWRCAKTCQEDAERPVPDCAYLQAQYKHGYTTTVGRTHADGTVRLAREIPYGSTAWKERYNQRNSSESRNSVQEGLGLKRLPMHGMPRSNAEVLLGDFVANQRTVARLVRESARLRPRLSGAARGPAPSGDQYQPDLTVTSPAERAPP